MSTRSRIGIEHSDGKITSVYCHHDGYLSDVGKTLYNHYNTEDRILELLTHGDMSSLGDTIESCEFYGNPADAALTHYTESQFREYAEEYNYLFRNGEWFWFYDDCPNWNKLEDVIR